MAFDYASPKYAQEAVAGPIVNVDLDGECITIDRTASESGGKRDIRDDLETRAAECVVAIPDIAMPTLRGLVERGSKGVNRARAGIRQVPIPDSTI
jgi:hypothetical protein